MNGGRSLRTAALSSIAPPGATSRPTRADQLERDFAGAIVNDLIAHRLRWLVVGSIVDALRSDILSSRHR